MVQYQIVTDDLSSESVRALLKLHLKGMMENTPADNVFALDLTGLQQPEVTVWIGIAFKIKGFLLDCQGFLSFRRSRTHMNVIDNIISFIKSSIYLQLYFHPMLVKHIDDGILTHQQEC